MRAFSTNISISCSLPQAVVIRASPHRTLLAPCRQTDAMASSPAVAIQASRLVSTRAASTSSGAVPTSAADMVASTSGTVDYFAVDKRPIILYDGVCNLCNGGVNQLIQLDTEAKYRLAALQSNPGRQLLVRCGRAPDDISSIVLVEEDGGHYIQSDAVLRIASRLGGPIPLLAAAMFSVPKPLRDAFYDQVANNRYNFFGRTNACRCDAGMDGYQDRFLGA